MINTKVTASSRLVNVDVIRIVAMLMVVVLHTNLNFTLRTDFFATKLWFALEPFVALSKTGVLLFFMLSGYLILSKNRSISDTLHRVVRRIGVPLFCFAAFGYFLEPHHFPYDLPERIRSFPGSWLWFLTVLIPLYVLNPLWQVLFIKKNYDLSRYITGVFLVFSVVSTLIQYSSSNTEGFYTNFTAWLGFLFFYLYGGLVASGWRYRSRWLPNWLLLWAGLFCTIAGDFFTQASLLPGYTQNYLSLPIIMMAVGLFNLLIHARLTLPYTRVLEWIAGLSFGVYLLHPYVVRVLFERGFTFDRLSLNVYVFNVVSYTLVLGTSMVLVAFLKKIPLLRRVIGDP